MMNVKYTYSQEKFKMVIQLYLIKHCIIIVIHNLGIIFHLELLIPHTIMLILNHINGNIPRSCVSDEETIYPHDLFYQCYKYCPEILLGKSIVRDSRDEPQISAKIELLSR